MGNAKIKHTKIMHIINANAVGVVYPKIFNTKIYRTKYLQFTIHQWLLNDVRVHMHVIALNPRIYAVNI